MSHRPSTENDFGKHISPSRNKTKRKRSRCGTQPSQFPPGFLALVAVTITAFFVPSHGFSFQVLPQTGARGLSLQAVKSRTSDTIQAVKPKSSSSIEKREAAIMAMKRKQVETALDSVDAQMLELLSDQFLYPNSPSSKPSTRPRGRPEMVPGAMKYETMVKFRENKDIMGRALNQELPTKNNLSEDLASDEVKNKEGSSKKKGKVKGSKGEEGDEPRDVTAGTRKRKRVVKNLPERKDGSKGASKRRRVLKGRAKANNLELQKYYRTELLTAEDEYSLGVKIQLMVKCEQVHEGLAIRNMRLPTIEEWANACG